LHHFLEGGVPLDASTAVTGLCEDDGGDYSKYPGGYDNTRASYCGSNASVSQGG